VVFIAYNFQRMMRTIENQLSLSSLERASTASFHDTATHLFQIVTSAISALRSLSNDVARIDAEQLSVEKTTPEPYSSVLSEASVSMTDVAASWSRVWARRWTRKNYFG